MDLIKINDFYNKTKSTNQIKLNKRALDLTREKVGKWFDR